MVGHYALETVFSAGQQNLHHLDACWNYKFLTLTQESTGQELKNLSH